MSSQHLILKIYLITILFKNSASVVWKQQIAESTGGGGGVQKCWGCFWMEILAAKPEIHFEWTVTAKNRFLKSLALFYLEI